MAALRLTDSPYREASRSPKTSAEHFFYKVLKKTYTPEEIREFDTTLNPPEHFEGGRFYNPESPRKRTPTTFENGNTERNVIVKTIPKGTLLFTYFKPSDTPTPESNVAKYLATFACPNITYNSREQKYEVCISTQEPALKYFYGVPYASNGIDDWGKKYSNIVLCVTKKDLQVVYSKSGTVVNDKTFTHKGTVAADPNRVNQCSVLKGSCRQGLSDDFCLLPQFAADNALDGIEQFSGQDSILEYDQTRKVFLEAGRGDMLRLIQSLVSDVLHKQDQLVERNDARYAEIPTKIAEVQAQLESEHAKLTPFYNKQSELQSLIVQIEKSYIKTDEELHRERQEIINALRVHPRYANRKKNAELEDVLFDVAERVLKYSRPMSAENKSRIDTIQQQIGKIEEEMYKDNKISQFERELQKLRTEQSTLNPARIETANRDFQTAQMNLNFLLLNLDFDHRYSQTFIGFSELVFNVFGYRSYTDDVFLPDTDELYTVTERTTTKQTMQISPEHLEAFLQKYIYPRNVLEPIGLINHFVQMPPPVCNPLEFPRLDASRPFPIDLFKKCMKYILEDYKPIPGQPYAPNIMYDLRTNLFTILQKMQRTIYEVPFLPGSVYNDSYKFLHTPESTINCVPVVTYSSDSSIATLSPDFLYLATRNKLLKMIITSTQPEYTSFNVYKLHTDFALLSGPFNQKVFPVRESYESFANFMHEFLAIIGDTKSTPVTLLKKIVFNDPVNIFFEAHNLGESLLGTYTMPTLEREISENQSNKPPVLNARASTLNLYSILGVNRNANVETIKKAYKKLVLTQHPNKGGDPEKFKNLELAYSTISNPVLRQAYNAQAAFPATQANAPPSLPLALTNANRGGYRRRRTHKKKVLGKRRKTRGRK